MKQVVRIGALVLTLLLLTGCSNTHNPRKKDSHGINRPDAIVPPAATTAPPSEEATVPTTIPESTAPVLTPRDRVHSAGFDAVYEDICYLLDTGDQSLEYTYANIGMKEVVMLQRVKADRYNSITYALEDMNNDGRLEMVVLDAADNSRILAIFAIQNGQPVMTHEGWYRSRLYRLRDNTLYVEGSNGAAYSIFELDGQRWFTYPKDENQTVTGYYYAADGSYDPSTAQEISVDEYRAKQAEFTQMITTFSVYYFD